MDARLKVVLGTNAGREIRLLGPKFLIGRAEDCHLRPRSDLISRHHCVLLLEEQTLTIRDLGSRNGTLVNGERVVGERELLTGDNLVVGPLQFEVQISTLAAPLKRPKVNSIKEAAARTAEGPPTGEPDVADWLQAGDASDATVSADTGVETETRELVPEESLETEEFGTGNTMVGLPGKAAAEVNAAANASLEAVQDTHAETQADQATSAVNKPATRPGKLPPVPPKGGDTRQAAADVLRKYFRRK
ncbi:MAG: FHA domain-containing protein [Pirellulales bacterium]|nr:FHA domain-containing protein [Pirellulales bacterium]